MTTLECKKALASRGSCRPCTSALETGHQVNSHHDGVLQWVTAVANCNRQHRRPAWVHHCHAHTCLCTRACSTWATRHNLWGAVVTWDLRDASIANAMYFSMVAVSSGAKNLSPSTLAMLHGNQSRHSVSPDAQLSRHSNFAQRTNHQLQKLKYHTYSHRGLLLPHLPCSDVRSKGSSNLFT